MIKRWLPAGLVCFGAWLAPSAHAQGVADCSRVLQFVDPIFAGSYNLVNGDDTVYRAGWNYWAPQAESRNWFGFEIPAFDAPLVGAELRLYAGQVWPTNVTVTYELHEVTNSFDTLAYHLGNRTNTFNDLGDGPVYGSRAISTSEGWWRGANSALLGIPLNAAALAKLTASQNDWFFLGGRVTATTPYDWGWVFDGYLNAKYPIQLVLYFSNAGPPKVSAVSYDPSLARLTDERVNLWAVACGKEPLRRQWMRNGDPVPGATNEILAIQRLSGSDAGDYWLVASNALGTATSDTVHLDVAPARITVQPRSMAVPEGQSVTLSVSAGPLPLSYQWRKDGIELVGSDRNSITFDPVKLDDAGLYDVIIYNSSAVMTSAVAQLIVLVSPPYYGDQEPRDLQVAVGLPLTISYYRGGGTPTDFQWFRDGEPVPGANSEVLNIPSSGFNDAGAYWVVAANAVGASTSAVTHVTVQPLVIYNMFNHTVLWRNPLTMNITIYSAIPVSQQWYFNNAPIPGATNEDLTFTAVEFSDQGPYFLVASNSYGAVTSEVATLTVVTEPSSVTIYSSNRTAWVGQDVGLTAVVSGGPPPTMQWSRNGVPLNGQTQATLVLASVTTNDSGVYRISAVNNSGAAAGEITLTVRAEAPFFINLPRTTNASVGDLVILRAKAMAGPPPTYQWRKDGVDLPGETNTVLYLDWVEANDGGVYEIVARNQLGEARYTHPLRVAPPTGLDRWRWRLPKPQGSRLYKAAWGNSRYVVAGKAGNAITSTDGHQWQSVPIEADIDLRYVASGNGVFVAAGSIEDNLIATNTSRLGDYSYQYNLNYNPAVVLVSSNGADWTVSRFPANDSVYDIAFGNGVFVAAAGSAPGFCYVSVDGLTWTSPPHTDQRRAYHIVYGNGRFVAEAFNVLYYSLDGITWTPSGEAATLIAFADGRFFVTDTIGVYNSVDGIAWTRVGSPSRLFPYWGFVGVAGKFVGKLDVPVGQIGFSSDGLTWIPVETGTRQELEHVIHANGEFLAVGEAGTITRSTTGLSWTPDEVANKIDFYGITHGEGLHVVAGDAGTILTSSNAIDWTRRATTTTRNLHAVAYGDGKFVAGGRSGAMMTSEDGITWADRNSGTGRYIERIAWANGLWVAVTEQGDITTSSNAVDWTPISTGFPLTDHEGVAYGNGVWVVVGGYFNSHNQAVDTIFSSTDGSTWTRRFYISAGKRWRDVTFGKGKFVAVGNDGVMSLSLNGTNWSIPRFIATQNLRRVHYANGRFIAVGNDGTLISSADPLNGLPWTKHRSHSSQNLHDIRLTSDGTLIYVGNNGMVLQSGDTRPRFLSIARNGRLEFDSGIAANLRLERSTNLRSWETEATNVTSPHMAPIGPGNKFWRLAGD